MTGIDLVHFFALLMIVGGTIRLVEYKWPQSFVGRGLAVIY